MKSLWQITIYLFAGIGAACVLGTAFYLASMIYDASTEASPARSEPIAQWAQPDSLAKDGGPFFLSIFGSTDVTSQTIYIGQRKDDFSYGQVIELDISNFIPNKETSFKDFLGQSLVAWSDDGVQITFPSRHSLFIPRNSFPKR